ncbi:oxysterols receptor LXR-beta isoform X2 [Microcaecilia unicolor]|uniref:Oxysterols receptor LXR-beta-like isoform X2 n=1 Tax=Microcaecilia unicolor TaxID=1415580 RepID=A0A6P7XKV2_9AMPH|nr:oxysterols receptor LXR-beta-like isoform X2 [Microcaecilia unicolor]
MHSTAKDGTPRNSSELQTSFYWWRAGVSVWARECGKTCDPNMSVTTADSSDVSLDGDCFQPIGTQLLDAADAARLQIKKERAETREALLPAKESEVLGTDGEGSIHSAEEPERKRKKGPAPKMLGNEVCSVCGDKASGFHYNVLSCEGCKGFFRRSVMKSAQYTCKNSGKCEMDMYMRRKCQECRLQKCREAGMREHCVLSEEQIRNKKIKKQQEEEVVRTASTVATTNPMVLELDVVQLTPQQEEMIQQLVSAQQQCNKRSFSDQPKVTPWPLGSDPNSREARQQRFAHFTELAIISVQEIVDFAKQVPGFMELSREDQIALLKASTIEIMLLETARRYNHETECITFLKDFTYSKDDFHRAGLQVEFINPIFEFSRGMREMQLDDAEYALLIAINIFSADRPNVQDHQLVENLQQPYVEALHSYTRIKRPQDHLMFPRMLMKLVSLRTLSSVHSEQVFALRLQDKKLPPLLSEIWDVHE